MSMTVSRSQSCADAIVADVFAYADYDSIDLKAIAAKHGVSQQRVASFMRIAKTNPNAWANYAKAYGFTESQRPPWVGTEPKEADVQASTLPVPGSIVPMEGGSRKLDARTVARTPARTSADANAPSDANASAEEPMPNVEDEMMNDEQVREDRVARGDEQVYRGSIQPQKTQQPTIEYIGSDAMNLWMKTNNVVEMDG